MDKNHFVDRAIKKHGCDLGGLFLNADGHPISRKTVQIWRHKFPPGRAIEWEKKIGDPRYLTAPTLYPPSEYRKRK